MLASDSLAGPGLAPAADWAISDGPVDYAFALDVMRRRAAAIRDNQSRELIWLLEHSPLYTGGTGAKDAGPA